jgi:hypothetical protein
MSFTDNFSCETHILFLKQKSETLGAFKQYEAQLTRQHNAKIKTLCSDHGGEFLSAKFNTYLASQGIKCELTVHDSPQQNGMAEHLNKMLAKLTHAMLLACNMPKFLWTAAVSYASWLHNHLPSRATPGHTPYNLVHVHHPNLAQAHKFGTKVYVHLQDAGKLEARAEEAIFIGVDKQSKGY